MAPLSSLKKKGFGRLTWPAGQPGLSPVPQTFLEASYLPLPGQTWPRFENHRRSGAIWRPSGAGSGKPSFHATQGCGRLLRLTQ